MFGCLGFRVSGFRSFRCFGVWGLGSSGFGVWGLGFRVRGLGFKGLGFRVAGFRVQGKGFRV